MINFSLFVLGNIYNNRRGILFFLLKLINSRNIRAFLFQGYPLNLALDEILEKHLIHLAFVVAARWLADQFRDIHHDLLSELI